MEKIKDLQTLEKRSISIQKVTAYLKLGQLKDEIDDPKSVFSTFQEYLDNFERSSKINHPGPIHSWWTMYWHMNLDEQRGNNKLPDAWSLNYPFQSVAGPYSHEFDQILATNKNFRAIHLLEPLIQNSILSKAMLPVISASRFLNINSLVLNENPVIFVAYTVDKSMKDLWLKRFSRGIGIRTIFVQWRGEEEELTGLIRHKLRNEDKDIHFTSGFSYSSKEGIFSRMEGTISVEDFYDYYSKGVRDSMIVMIELLKIVATINIGIVILILMMISAFGTLFALEEDFNIFSVIFVDIFLMNILILSVLGYVHLINVWFPL